MMLNDAELKSFLKEADPAADVSDVWVEALSRRIFLQAQQTPQVAPAGRRRRFVRSLRLVVAASIVFSLGALVGGAWHEASYSGKVETVVYSAAASSAASEAIYALASPWQVPEE